MTTAGDLVTFIEANEAANEREDRVYAQYDDGLITLPEAITELTRIDDAFQAALTTH